MQHTEQMKMIIAQLMDKIKDLTPSYSTTAITTDNEFIAITFSEGIIKYCVINSYENDSSLFWRCIARKMYASFSSPEVKFSFSIDVDEYKKILNSKVDSAEFFQLELIHPENVIAYIIATKPIYNLMKV